MSRNYQLRSNTLVDLRLAGLRTSLTDASTGVPSGITLTTYLAGPTLAPGTYENMLFPTQGTYYTFTTGSNIVVRNCLFQEAILFDACDNILIEFCDTTAVSFSSCHGVTARRLNLHASGGDFIDVTGDHTDRLDNRCLDVLIEECYVHDPQTSDPLNHVDGMQTRGVAGLTVRNCVFDLGPWADPLNAAIFLENANGGTSDVTIDHNYLNGGGYIGRFQTVSGTFTITNNAFGPDGHFGTFTLKAPLPTLRLGNVTDQLQPLNFVVND